MKDWCLLNESWEPVMHVFQDKDTDIPLNDG